MRNKYLPIIKEIGKFDRQTIQIDNYLNDINEK